MDVATTPRSPCAVSCAHFCSVNSCYCVLLFVFFSFWNCLFFHFSIRWGVVRSTCCNCHPFSVGSEHSFSSGSDFLQSPQEQTKATEQLSSFHKWYDIAITVYPLYKSTEKHHTIQKSSFISSWEQFQMLIYLWLCFWTGQQSVSLTAAPVSTPKVQAALHSWEIPEDCVLEGLEFWQTGRHGPICKGLLKKRDGASSAVVVKSLRGTTWICHEAFCVCVVYCVE